MNWKPLLSRRMTTAAAQALIALGILISLSSYVLAQERGWSEPMLLSVADSWSWFPDIAVDLGGRIHVVYDGNRRVSQDVSEDGSVPAVMYTVSQGGEWGEPNDLHLGGRGNIFRSAIAVDRFGNLHMVCKRGGAGSELDYRQASVETAYSAQGWNRHVLDKGVIYMSDVAVDSDNVIHVVYEKWVPFEEPFITEGGREISQLSDIFYRRSVDGGRTWSIPVNLSQTPRVGDYRVQLKIDANDVIHVTWDEGFDRWALYGEPRVGIYINSTDGGQTWSSPVQFYMPEHTNAQMAAASDNRGNVLAVWRSTSIDRVYYAWSTDGGLSWSEAQPIPAFYTRSYNETMFDAYDMMADSAGNIHLVAVGRSRLPVGRGEDVPLGVYHLVWDGERWLAPEPVYVYEAERGFPEYPKLVISAGNQLHVVWFVRDQQFGGAHTTYRIFYSYLEAEAPLQFPEPTPTLTPTPAPTVTSTPLPTVTPWPTVNPTTSGMPSGVYTDIDDTLRLLASVLPIGVLLFLLAAVRLGWFRKLLSR